MRLIFAAGDVGGARAILPLAYYAASQGHRIEGHANGTFQAEGDSAWIWHDRESLMSPKFWTDDAPDAFIFATSVNDADAVDINDIAAFGDIPRLHILDNWSNYIERFEREGNRRNALLPDLYAVMDKVAYRAAIASGIPKDSLIISGHPNLTGVETVSSQPIKPGRPERILFVSEPAAIDNATGAHRGYDEDVVSSIVCGALAQSDLSYRQIISLFVAVHPRENSETVESRWRERLVGTDIRLHITQGLQTRHALEQADHVIGMSSILLYESWLLGKPVTSIQPELKMESLRSFFLRDGLFAFDNKQAAREHLLQLFSVPSLENPNERRQNDIESHVLAPRQLLGRLEALIGDRAR